MSADSPAIGGNTRRAPAAAAELAVWYLALLVPTLWFKYQYVTILSGDDLSGFDPAANAGHMPFGLLYVDRFFPMDVLDVFVVVGLLFFVGRVLLRVPIASLVCGTVLAALVVGAASAFALEQTGTLLTMHAIRTAWNWGIEHPRVIRLFFTGPMVLTASFGVLWMIASLFLVNSAHRAATSDRRVITWALPAAMILLLVYALCEGGLVRQRQADRWSLSRGFWSGVFSSILRLDDTSPLKAPVMTRADIASAYQRLVFPRNRPAAPSWVVDIPAGSRTFRNIVIIGLETAPRKYYSIADDPSLPVFHAMSQHALISDWHYTSAPTSILAVYGLMTGTYARAGAPLVRYGDFETDGLAATLGRHGYETTFINFYDLHWNGLDDERTLRDLRFATILDARQLTVPPEPDAYADRMKQESRSFEAALDQIRGAATRGKKALVYLATNLGHYDWATPPGAAQWRSADKLARTARDLDRLTGTFLAALTESGLADDTIIVIVGDHGLRFKMEFDSLGERPDYGDVTFNVPLMVYAPGLFPAAVRLPYATSHVDLTPTLLDLMGVPRHEGLYHGDNMLDRRLEDRILFLPSGAYPGLHPVDGFRWRDYVYAVYEVTDRVTVRGARQSDEHLVGQQPGSPFSESEAASIVRTGQDLFNATAGYFLRHRSPQTVRP